MQVSGTAHPLAKSPIVDESQNGITKSMRVTGPDEQSGFAIDNDLAEGAYVAADHWFATSHRFYHDQAERLR